MPGVGDGGLSPDTMTCPKRGAARDGAYRN